MDRWLPLLATGLWFVLLLALPTLVVAIRHGQMAIVFQREADRWQRLIGMLFGLLLTSLLAWAILYGAAGPEALGIWPVPLGFRWMGAALLVAGVALTAVAQTQMGASWRVGIDDRPTALVTSGLYRYVRNPIFSAMILTFIGFVLLFPSWATSLGLLAIIAAISAQVRLEERHLAATHGAEWGSYASSVGRFVPALGRLRRGTAPQAVRPGGDVAMPPLAFRGMAVFFALRDLLVRPDSVVGRAGLRPGERVLDFGCGPGSYSLAAARRVGANGTVQAQDIVPIAAERLRARAHRLGLRNLEVRCSARDTGLADESMDRVLALDVMHMLSARREVLAELRRVLKPGGLLVTTSDHMPEAELLSDCEAAGLLLERRDGSLIFLRGRHRDPTGAELPPHDGLRG